MSVLKVFGVDHRRLLDTLTFAGRKRSQDVICGDLAGKDIGPT